MNRLRYFCRILCLAIALSGWSGSAVLAERVFPGILDLTEQELKACASPFQADITIDCYEMDVGGMAIEFYSLDSEIGLIKFVSAATTEFYGVGTGKVFFFERLSGGKTEDGTISARNIFCMQTRGGHFGYEWNGTSYNQNDEASEVCPIP